MNIVNLIQGSAEWHAHRAKHFNASDAPAMMGCSPYKTRAQLVREMATGVSAEVDAATQRRFDAGHRFEELARPLAEQIIGEELYPCVGTDGKLSASFDGLTLTGDTAFEHKTLNASLRAALVDGGDNLPSHYQVQMEQQLLVSGAERVLFMASMWDADGVLIEERHCWYTSSPSLRAQIVAGWEQLAADVAAYEAPAAAEPAPIAAPVQGFGVLTLQVEGRVLASNLDAFKAGAEAFIACLPKPAELQDDQDFVDAEQAVKACADAESRIKAAKDAVLGQMADVDAILRTADSINEAIRAARLALDKAVKAEKENRKAEIVQAGAAAVSSYVAGINASLGEHAITAPAGLVAELGLAIKGKKSLASMRDAIDTAVAAQKIDINQYADSIRACSAVLGEFADHHHLFADRVQLCAGKTPEDLRNLAKTRIAEHEQRLEQDRERIRAEEAAKLEREQAAAELAAAKASQAGAELSPAAQKLHEQEGAQRFSEHHRLPAAAAATIKLGEINALIAPLSITADGLAQLGIQPAGTERAAKLYASADMPHILNAIAAHINSAAREARWAA